MLLTFKTVDQLIFKIDVDPAEKIKSLKKRIQNDRGCEYIAEGMKLLFAGKILDDEKSISDYSISDKGFIVIMVPRPKTPGKECGKKTRSSQAQFPVISAIDENLPSFFDGNFSDTDPADPAVPRNYSQWREKFPPSGHSSDNETSVASQRRAFQSQVSADSGQLDRSSKRLSYRSVASSESSRHAAMVTREMSHGGVVTTGSIAGSSTVNDVPPSESYTTDMLMSPLQTSEKNLEVEQWLEKHVVDEPASVVERSSSRVDENAVENIQKIVAMGFERDQAEIALNASFNSVEGAVEYLCTRTSPASAPAEARVPAFARLPPVVQRFPSVVRSGIDLDDPLEFLKTNEEFQFLRLEVQKNPDAMVSALDSFRSSHSDLEPIFQAFEDRLVELLTEPLDDSPTLAPAAAAVAMATTAAAQSPPSPSSNLSTPDLKEIEEPSSHHHLTTTSHPSLDHQSDPIRSSQSDQLLNPIQSSSADTDRILDLPVVSDDSTSSSPSLIERRLSPIGKDASGMKTPPGGDEEEEEYEPLRDEEEEKLSEELIRALLLQDQEEEERMEAERRAAGAAEAISWNDAETLEGGVASGVGGTGGGMAGGGGVGGRGGRGGGRTLEDRGYVRVTLEEKQAIDRLKSLGFSEERVVQVYLACEKNEETAANLLLDKD